MNAIHRVAIILAAASMAAGAQDWSSYQARPTPFQACTPSRPPVVSLTLTMARSRMGYAEPRVRVSLRNLTERPVVIVKRDTLEMFSATVLDARGGRVGIQKGTEDLYRTAAEIQAELRQRAGARQGETGPMYIPSAPGGM